MSKVLQTLVSRHQEVYSKILNKMNIYCSITRAQKWTLIERALINSKMSMTGTSWKNTSSTNDCNDKIDANWHNNE